MNPSYYVDSYAAHLRGLQERHGEARAWELLVGDTDHWVGVLEKGVLLNLGLEEHDSILDVGCGTGRLSWRLSAEHKGRFIGTDILAPVVDYARRRTNRPDWEFQVAVEPPLPAADASVDWVTFFSVFTHIVDEDIYRYLADAKRLIKPTGRIVFSYLDYANPEHWPLFEQSVADRAPLKLLTHFLNRTTIEAWASRLGLKVQALHDGAEPWIKLGPPLVLHDLTAPFWQSIAVLSKPEA